MVGRRDSDGESESRRILDRVAREAESGSPSLIARAAKGARDHVSAADADRSDPIEIWGTRIGRLLGLVLGVGLVIWLALFIVNGG